MKPEFEKYHLIDRYLRGELSSEELASFRGDLSGVPGFAEEVEHQRKVNELISENAYYDIRQQMTREILIRDQNRGIMKWFGGGLLLLALLLASAWFVLINKGSDSSSLNKNGDKQNVNGINTNPVGGKDKGNIRENPLMTVAAPVNKNPESVLKQKERSEQDTENQNMKLSVADTGPEDVVDIKIRRGVKGDSSGKTEERDYKIISVNDSSINAKDQVSADPCENTEINVPWSVLSACTGQNTGAIVVEMNKISGGTKPYLLELHGENPGFHSSRLDRLFSGNYTLKVIDGKGCTVLSEVYVDEKPCSPTHVSISPDHGEIWQYYGNESNSYYFSILDQTGQLIYRSPVLTGNTEWAGTFNSGVPVKAGLYIYIVEYTNGKKENGQITVIR